MHSLVYLFNNTVKKILLIYIYQIPNNFNLAGYSSLTKKLFK